MAADFPMHSNIIANEGQAGGNHPLERAVHGILGKLLGQSYDETPPFTHWCLGWRGLTP